MVTDGCIFGKYLLLFEEGQASFLKMPFRTNDFMCRFISFTFRTPSDTCCCMNSTIVGSIFLNNSAACKETRFHNQQHNLHNIFGMSNSLKCI